MKYELVATDFDNTIYSDEICEVSEYTVSVLNKYVASGGILVICTGRCVASILPLVRNMGLKGELVVCGGAGIYDILSSKRLQSQTIDSEIAIDFIRFVQEKGAGVQLYYGFDYYIDKEDKYTANYSKYCGIYPIITGKSLVHTIKQLGEPDMIYVYYDETRIQALRDEARDLFGDKLTIAYSTTYNMECTSKRATKGRAIRQLADKYHIDIENVLAFGDNGNDISMIELVGCGVAVANATVELKLVADQVCESCLNNGVAKYIEQIILGD